jgi:sulfate/thiosulfate transport system substrate-binding protein
MTISSTPLNKPRLILKIAVSCLMLAFIVWTIWPLLPFGRSKRPETIVIYGFSIIEPAITKSVFPAFQKKWMAQTGQEVEMIGSFAGSGTVTNQLIMGVPAELAILSTELDADRLRESGTINGDTWKMLPHGGVINRSPFVILVRPGNPKKIHDFSDLARPGIRIVHPDPFTSGAANWAIIAEYGSAVRRPNAGLDAGRTMLLGIWRNVVAQAGSGRAVKTQFDNGFGDALITYEQDALWGRVHGSPPFEIIYPHSTILSEHTLVVIDHNISEKRKELVHAFVDFIWSEEAQRLFVENGFRSVNEKLNSANRTFGHIADPFFIRDFGGWQEAKRTIIDATWKNEVLKELRP